MSHAYNLYFDTPPSNWERRRRTCVLALVIATHLFLLGWALRTLPPIAKDASSSLVVVLLTNAVTAASLGRHAESANGIVNKPGLGNDKPAHRQITDTLRVTDAARPPIAEGQIKRADGERTSSSAALTAAIANGAGGNEASLGNSTGAHGSLRPLAFVPPRVVHHWKAPYPAEALAAYKEGEAEVLVTIAADGSLMAARIDKSSGNESLDAATLESVKRYIFSAAEKGGNPVEADAIVSVEWTITPAMTYGIMTHLPQDRANWK